MSTSVPDEWLLRARDDTDSFDDWFASEPIIYPGQEYFALGTEPYIRKTDGRPTTLRRWRSRCAECGRPFEFFRSIRVRFAPNRRCAVHRKPGVRVRRRRVEGGAR